MKKIIMLVFCMMFIAGCGYSQTPTATNSDLLQYHKKVLHITTTDSKLKGVAGIEVQGAQLSVKYTILINDQLSQNRGNSYDYAVALAKDKGRASNGSLARVDCNKDKLPEDPFGYESLYFASNCGLDPSKEAMKKTDTFSTTFIERYDSYEEVLQQKTFELFDSSSFWEDDPECDTCRQVNTERAVTEGKMVKSYELTYEE